MRSASHPNRLSRTTRWFTGLTLLATFIGCSKAPPVGPTAAADPFLVSAGTSATASGFGSATFYPLETGNHWAYEGESRLAIRDAEGNPAGEGFDILYTESHTILGTEHRDGRVYSVREQTRNELTEPYVGTSTDWTRMRQDRTGLFAAAFSSEPPTLDGRAGGVQTNASTSAAHLDFSALRARGFGEEAVAKFAARVERLRKFTRNLGSASTGRTAEADELTWLLYPVRPGTEWNMVPGFDWPARVDRIEILDTPSGRIQVYRIETNPLGEPMKDGEYVRLWYGRSGFVGYSIHASSAAVDDDGNPTDLTAHFDDTMLLTSASLGR